MLGRFEDGLPCVKNALYLAKGGRRYLLAECQYRFPSCEMFSLMSLFQRLFPTWFLSDGSQFV